MREPAARRRPVNSRASSGGLAPGHERLPGLFLEVADRHPAMTVAIRAAWGLLFAAVFVIGLVTMRPHRPQATPTGPELLHLTFRQL